MANYDSRVILAGQPFNALASISAGQEAGARAMQIKDQNKRRDIYAQHGAGILAGEQNSLNALAGVDPQAAMGMRQAQQAYAQSEERMNMARAEGARAAQRLQMDMDAAALKSEQAKLKQGLAAAVTAQTPEQWDALAQQFGAPDLVGQFANREAIIGFYSGLDETLDRMTPPKPLSPPGKVQADINAGLLPEGTKLRGDQAPQVGSIPQGYELAHNPETGGYQMRPIPGGPADTSAEDALARESKETSANIVLDEIDLALDLVREQSGDSPTTGLIGGALSRLDWTDAGSLKNRLITIKANIGFDKLQAMRDASPTGGALGQVSEFENRLLQSVFGSLAQSQRKEDVEYNLNRLRKLYDRIIHQGIPDDEARALYRGEAGDGDDLEAMTTEQRAEALSQMTTEELLKLQEEYEAAEPPQTSISRREGR